MKRYQYKRIRLIDGGRALDDGTYEPPAGWRVVSLSTQHASAPTLLLEREIGETSYRDGGQ